MAGYLPEQGQKVLPVVPQVGRGVVCARPHDHVGDIDAVSKDLGCPEGRNQQAEDGLKQVQDHLGVVLVLEEGLRVVHDHLQGVDSVFHQLWVLKTLG